MRAKCGRAHFCVPTPLFEEPLKFIAYNLRATFWRLWCNYFYTQHCTTHWVILFVALFHQLCQTWHGIHGNWRQCLDSLECCCKLLHLFCDDGLKTPGRREQCVGEEWVECGGRKECAWAGRSVRVGEWQVQLVSVNGTFWILSRHSCIGLILFHILLKIANTLTPCPILHTGNLIIMPHNFYALETH